MCRAIEAAFQGSLTELGSGPRVAQGIRVGVQAANAILAARAGDGAAARPTPYVPQPGPGEYQLTPPSFAPAAFTQTAHVQPFVLRRVNQFRPAPPPELTSARYARDWKEVKSLGEQTSATRSALAAFPDRVSGDSGPRGAVSAHDHRLDVLCSTLRLASTRTSR